MKNKQSFNDIKYYSACCRCQYYIDKKCTNKGECIWLDIEKELKRLEEIDNGAHVPVHINRYNELCDKEKALEIIKSKEINMHSLFLHLKRFDSPDGYNALVGAKYQITQEEWDFLKEVIL